MSENIILKIVSGKAPEEEKELFFKSLESNPDLKKEYIRLKNLWALSVDEKAPDVKMKFEKFWTKATGTSKRNVRQLVLRTTSYAAMLAVALVFTFWLGTKINTQGEFLQTFTSEAGSVSSVELNDGSRIWLNSGSTLKFTEQSSKRMVAKLTGEGYFEIRHNPDREFLVDLGGIKIRDLGTEFNIRAYPKDERISATLKDGKIEVLSSEDKRLVEMEPNDHFELQLSNNKYTVEKADPQYIAGWKEGKFVFIDKNLREICDELEKWYGVTIEIRNKELQSTKFTSILKRTTSIKHMLEMLKVTTGFNYKIEINENGNDTIIIN